MFRSTSTRVYCTVVFKEGVSPSDLLVIRLRKRFKTGIISFHCMDLKYLLSRQGTIQTRRPGLRTDHVIYWLILLPCSRFKFNEFSTQGLKKANLYYTISSSNRKVDERTNGIFEGDLHRIFLLKRPHVWNHI